MRKIIAILIVMVMAMSMMPSAISETDTVTGTFTPVATGVSIACNNTTPGFGSINLGASGEVTYFNVTNEGNQNCSVTMTAGYHASNNWTLVAGTSSPATSNEYCVNMDPNQTGYVDVYTEKTVYADLIPSGAGVNYTRFDLKVFVSDFTTGVGEQTFYANLTASALS